MTHLSFQDKIGILDPSGIYDNPLTHQPYSDNYKNLSKIWASFPAYSKAHEILQTMRDNQITLIVSSTGSGKTVLIPKLALHYINYTGKVAVTLPKRIVTLTAAEFGAETLDVAIGTHVGYAYKNSPKNANSGETKLLYMTDGLLISKFMRDPKLSDFDVIIIDEAHERSIRIDLLMLFLKKLLESGDRPDLRVIIMSATIDTKKFKNYFVNNNSGTKINCSIIELSGTTNHEITTHFMDKPIKSYMDSGFQLVRELIDATHNKSDAMLFFVTTSNEALQICKDIKKIYTHVYCVEVYRDMDPNLKSYAQNKYKYTELGDYDTKLIIATNIAESSLTIDGLKTVIDSGYELFSHFDHNTYGDILERRLITKAQALQRRGRVGRTEPGICWHLLTQQQFSDLREFPDPDISRQDITNDLLQIVNITGSKMLTSGLKMISQLMDPPPKLHIDAAVNIYNIYNLVNDDVLTKSGRKVAALAASGMSVNRILFMLYAYDTYCAKDACVIIAFMEKTGSSLKSIFHCVDKCNLSTNLGKIKSLLDKNSDHISYRNIYTKCIENPDWANRHNINRTLMAGIKKLAHTYYYRLSQVMQEKDVDSDESRVQKNDMNIINALKKSHVHLTSNKLHPVIYPGIKISINNNSVVTYFKKKISPHFVYDKITNINGKWEVSGVTLIQAQA